MYEDAPKADAGARTAALDSTWSVPYGGIAKRRSAARRSAYAPLAPLMQTAPDEESEAGWNASLGKKPQVNGLMQVPPAGFEPATPALGERCSIP